MSRRDALVRHVRTNLEEPLILAALGKMAFSGMDNLTDTDQAVLAAFRRSSTELARRRAGGDQCLSARAG